jgi:hypothetical protein
MENNDSEGKVVGFRSTPRLPMTESDLQRLTIYCQSESNCLNAIISQCYNTATTVMLIALVVAAATSTLLPLFLLAPAAIMIVIAEMHVEILHAVTLEYMRRCGIDVSDVPKPRPLFPSLRRWFKRT